MTLPGDNVAPEPLLAYEGVRLLVDGLPVALPRHRTLRSTIDWSYELLTDVEQAMLLPVSVFAGGWTLAAAEHVCTGDGIGKPDTIGLLTSLTDKDLIISPASVVP